MKNAKWLFLLLTFFVVLVLFIVSINSLYFSDFGTNSYFNEDQFFTYNFSSNVTVQGGDILPISYSTKNFSSSQYPSQTSSSFYPWFSLNSSSGVLSVNATNDSMSGKFNVTIEVLNSNSPPTGATQVFYFIINATNDPPSFTAINNSYNLTQNQSFISYVNGSDEESQYPLYFNVSFVGCSLPQWSTRNNCTLFNFVSYSNASAMINITPLRNDVGIYTANISVTDWGEHYNSTAYPFQVPNYSQNKTSYYSQLVNFTVFASLDINYSDCENKIFQQNQTGSCLINITTRNSQDNFNVSSNATLRNYPSGNNNIFNKSWFLSFNQTFSQNYSSSVTINITPQVTEVGNWTINFSLYDINFSQSSSVQIHVYVNKTLNFVPYIQSVGNQVAALNSLANIQINVWDNDLLIPDKSETGGGYNETLNFTAMILNRSNLNQILTINGANNLTVVPIYISGTNLTTVIMSFTPNLTSGGNYTINLSAKDKYGTSNFTLFNLSIASNNPPNWTSPHNTTIYEGNLTLINFSSYAVDYDNDPINFTFSNDTSFPSFLIDRATGISNFTPDDSDVGQHLITVNASDQFFSVPYTFNITVYNIPDSPFIVKPINVSGIGSFVANNSNITAIELSSTTISLFVDDNDFKIPQKSFYDENLTINCTVQGTNTSLLTFVRNSSTPINGSNRTQFYATFIPRRNDNGTYFIFANVSDKTNRSDYIQFNMTINLINPAPVLNNISNITTAVTRNIYYRFNASDIYDGNSTDSGNNKFTFWYSFLNGTNFINNNQSIFNTTSGELNITFNSSQGGIYRLNITVSNSQMQNDSKVFWIFVYDYPSINFPLSSSQFNFIENGNYNLTFISNSTISNNNYGILDNLTYLIYLDSYNTRYLAYNFTNYYGNNTNLTFLLTPNFTSETDGIKNFTIIVYPSTVSLNNSIDVNTTANWNMTINHTNSPLTFSGNIGGLNRTITGGSPQQVFLSDYFNDVDATDPLHNETITFGYSASSTNGSIAVNLVNWVNESTPLAIFSTDSYGKADYIITAYEWNESNYSQQISNVTSNMFNVEITNVPVVTPTPSSGGGGGSSSTIPVPYALKIIAPTKISGFANQKIIIPLKLINNGKETFKNISMFALGLFNSTNTKAMILTFDKSYLDSLAPGESKNITMTVLFNTTHEGDYEITVNATSKSPKYTDWSKIYISLQNTNESDARKYVLFTEEYIVQNPNCLELKEKLNEADKYIAKGDYANARAVAESVLNLCKSSVEQASIPKTNPLFSSVVIEYFIVAVIISIIGGISYYYIRRRNYRMSAIKMKSLKNNKSGEI